MPDRPSNPAPPSGRPPSSIWPKATDDRARAGAVVTGLVAFLLGASFWLALGTLEVGPGGEVVLIAAVLTSVLAVVVLRSVPLRWVARGYVVAGGAMLLRFGVLGHQPGVAAAGDVLLWVLCATAALALCPSPMPRPRVGVGVRPDSVPSAAIEPRSGVAAGRARRERSADPWAIARGAVAATLAVAAVLLLAGPWAGERSQVAPSSGASPDELDRGPQNALSAQEQLDMTRRPRLSAATVMTVRSDIVSFWRTNTYDRWDGAAWTNSDGGSYRQLGPFGEITPPTDDLAATSPNARESTQEFRLESRFANSLPAAPSPVQVRSDSRLIQRPDGSIIAPEGLGRGATYTVTGRQVLMTADDIVKLGDGINVGAGSGSSAGGGSGDGSGDGSGEVPTIPNEIAQRYASTPKTTARVKALANQIVTEAGADTAFDKVTAIEKWMGDNLEYSLDAPLAPQGVDVVDDFLFQSKLGWCEQIASSLVVMLREVGVPTRLATGFAPGERDGTSGRFIVRERDAHAWAEVWFPEVGWVAFDPTASVPLSGDAAAPRELPVGFAGLAVVLLFIGTVAVLAAPLARKLHASRTRRSERRALARLAAERWDVRAEQDLEARGIEVGRPRAPSESVAGYGRELAAITGDDELARVGAAVDDHRYGPPT